MDVASLLLRVGIKTDTDALDKLQSRLESINGKLRILAGAEIIRGLFHLTENFGHSALELENTAAAAGLTTEAMQKLQFAVAQSGGNASELGMTMSHLARMIESAKLGGDEAITTFYKLGISQQAIQSYHNTEDALFGVMDALRQIKDPIKQHALLDQALGQGSRGLGRFALAGSTAARQTIRSAKSMGAIIPSSTIRQLADAKASLDGLGKIFKSVSGTIAGMFAPSLITVINGIEKFYSANKALLDAKLERWLWNVSVGFGELYAITYIAARAIVNFITHHKVLVETVEQFLPIIAAVGSGLFVTAKAFSLLRTAAQILIVPLGAVVGLFTAANLEMLGLAVAAGAVAAAVTLTVMTLKSALQELVLGYKWEQTDIGRFMIFAQKGLGFIQSMRGMVSGRLGRILHEFQDPAKSTALVDQDPTGRYDAPEGFGSGFSPLLDRLNAVQYSAAAPPGFLAQPPQSMVGGNMSYDPQIINNVTVNAANLTPQQAKEAIVAATRQANDKGVAQAMQRLQRPYLY